MVLRENGGASLVWEALGITGAVIFFGRFYLQWYVSERHKRSIVPVAFWYMSGVGALLLLPYAVFYLQSPVGALSYSFNCVVYARNLVHIWREKGTLSRGRSAAMNIFVAAVVVLALVLVVYTWWTEYHGTKHADTEVVMRIWFWIAVGTAGQVLFGFRFLLQWLVTELRRKSVIPVAFWYLSIVASVLQIAAYSQRAEWVLALGLVANLPVYVRNLWFIHKHDAPPPGLE